MKVLDIGCGTGGSAFYMAKHYGVEVLGVDLSQNMLDIANEHKQKLFDEKVSFQCHIAYPKERFEYYDIINHPIAYYVIYLSM